MQRRIRYTFLTKFYLRFVSLFISIDYFQRQGEMTVSSKPEAAFALASIIVNLWTDFPDFGDLLLAHFQRHCPYLAPVFLPQVEGQSDQDYYR